MIIVSLCLIGLVIFVLSEKARRKVLFNIMLARVTFMNRGALPPPDPYALVSDKLSEITVTNFIHCTVTGDKSVLAIDGKPNEKQLHEAWEKISQEYNEKANKHRSKKYIDMTREIGKHALRLNWVSQMCDGLLIHRHEVFIEELKKYYPDRAFSIETAENDVAWVKTAEIRIKSIHKRLVKQREEMFPTDKNANTEDDYYNILGEILKHRGVQDFPIKIAQTMRMDDFCLALNEYNEHIERLKRQQALKKAQA